MSEVEREVAGLRVVIDGDLCIGSQSCITIAPELFELDSRQAVRFVEGGAEDVETDRARVLESCQVCPTSALAAYDGEKRLVP
ncbi:MAG: ferredoxin [Acidobacteriota bacterium]